ncbi:protein of unknown function [Xenorhabdus poinarii G6]|uniref:Uncharacterized protein n=1 Tax=Xenorhabdus poinarii G6 TaxID=1354304 RepID=A0A068R9L2_9GAMM|nr:protein of unknown function [Xenorhabdus poinarii G6]
MACFLLTEHGRCTEISYLDQALNIGLENLTNATFKSLNIGISEVAYKSPKPACANCSYVLKILE